MITSTKLYVPVVTLCISNNINFLEKINKDSRELIFSLKNAGMALVKWPALYRTYNQLYFMGKIKCCICLT